MKSKRPRRPWNERFEEKIEVTENNCFIWTASATFALDIRNGKQITVHPLKLAYFIMYGEWVSGTRSKKGKKRNLCGNLKCINPEHWNITARRKTTSLEEDVCSLYQQHDDWVNDPRKLWSVTSIAKKFGITETKVLEIVGKDSAKQNYITLRESAKLLPMAETTT